MSTTVVAFSPPVEEIAAPAEPQAERTAQAYGGSYASLAAWIHSDVFSRGDRAILRRLSPDLTAVPPEVFWRATGERVGGEDDERFWRTALPLMATHPHFGTRSLGEQLEGTQGQTLLANARLERWLRQDRERAREDARRVLTRLEGGVNWAELGPLLHYWTPAQRKRVAQSFFRARHRRV